MRRRRNHSATGRLIIRYVFLARLDFPVGRLSFREGNNSYVGGDGVTAVPKNASRKAGRRASFSTDESSRRRD